MGKSTGWTVGSLVFFLCVVLCVVQSSAQAAKTFAVGMETKSFVDQSRRNYANTGPRPLQTVIWFPAAAGTVPAVQPEPDGFTKGMFVLQPVVPNAPLPSGNQKYPLIVLSHGTSSIALSMSWLGWYLAAHGFIVAGVNHHGNTGAEPRLLPQGFMLEWERPRDLSVLIDKLMMDPKFGAHIDPERIAAAGHSAGGATVIELAGGVFDADNIKRFCNAHPDHSDCTLPPIFQKWEAEFERMKGTDPVVQQSLRHQHDPHRDPRIKAVLAMAPAVGDAFSAATLQSIRIPVYVVAGAGDKVVSPVTNAEWYAREIPGAQLKIFPGEAGHYVFGTECTTRGEKALEVCRDGPGVNRAQIHRDTERMALEFFEKSFQTK